MEMQKDFDSTKRLKYEIMKEQYFDSPDRPRLYRIRALRDIPEKDVVCGDFGGWVEDEKCLSQDGHCWIGGMAMVYDGSTVKGFATVNGTADISGGSTICDHAIITDNAKLVNVCAKDSVKIFEHAEVKNSILKDFSKVHGRAKVDVCELNDGAVVCDEAEVQRSELFVTTVVCNNATVRYSRSSGTIRIEDHSYVGHTSLEGDFTISGSSSILSSDLYGSMIVKDYANIKFCSALNGEGIVIGGRATLINDNYYIVAPLGDVEALMVYWGAGEIVLYTAGYELFDDAEKMVKFLCGKTKLRGSRLKRLVKSLEKLLVE